MKNYIIKLVVPLSVFLAFLLITALSYAFKDKNNAHVNDKMAEAILNNNFNQVEVLLKNGAEANHVVEGLPLLYMAVVVGNAKICQILLENKAKPDTPIGCKNDIFKDRNGQTELLLAAQEGNLDICALLLQYHADINKTAPDGRTALFVAVHNKQKDTCDLLLQNGANVDMATNNGLSPLAVAVNNDDYVICKLLLDRHAQVNQINNRDDGLTPLHVAAQAGYVEICELLLQYGADINQKNKDGATPLIMAIDANKKDACALLLRHNADTSLIWRSRTLISVAQDMGHTEIAKLLEVHK